MASSPEAALIRYLSPGFGPSVALGGIFKQLFQALDLALESVNNSWWVMAGNAGHVTMRRDLPGPVKRLHVVAGVTKSGARGVFHRAVEK